MPYFSNHIEVKNPTLLQQFIRGRQYWGPPHPIAYLRSLVKTRKFTRTVNPPKPCQ
jgi:hypothetical protein